MAFRVSIPSNLCDYFGRATLLLIWAEREGLAWVWLLVLNVIFTPKLKCLDNLGCPSQGSQMLDTFWKYRFLPNVQYMYIENKSDEMSCRYDSFMYIFTSAMLQNLHSAGAVIKCFIWLCTNPSILLGQHVSFAQSCKRVLWDQPIKAFPYRSCSKSENKFSPLPSLHLLPFPVDHLPDQTQST